MIQNLSNLLHTVQTEWEDRFESLQKQVDSIERRTAADTSALMASPHLADYGAAPHTNYAMATFLRDPISLHRSLNRDSVLLSFEGSNFSVWQSEVDRTLSYAFSTNPSFVALRESFTGLRHDQAGAVMTLLRSTLDRALDTVLLNYRDAFQLYTAIAVRYQEVDRQHKLLLVNQLKEFYSPAQGTSLDQRLAKFTSLASDLIAQKLTIDELLGLILQSTTGSPPTKTTTKRPAIALCEEVAPNKNKKRKNKCKEPNRPHKHQKQK